MSKIAISSETTVGQSADLVSVDIAGQTVLMSISQGAYYGTDAVGSRVWQLLAEPRPVAVVVDQLTTEFAVERPTCERHVLGFLQKLADAGVLVVK